jgi:FkbM family methyltransferase
MRFELRDSIQRELYLNGSLYERADIDLIASHCSGEGTVFLDIGANLGVYAFWILSRFPSTKVFAFEPNPRTFRQLAETKSLGNYPTLHIVEVALGDAPGTASMHATDRNSACATLGAGLEVRGLDLAGLKEYLVPVMTFDAWWEENRALFTGAQRFVIKLDVEGFEPRVIKGMSNFLTTQPVSLILVEFFEGSLRNAGHTTTELFNILVDSGYAGYSDREFKIPITAAPPAPDPVNVYFRPRVQSTPPPG